jgi:predicted glutamine amidotransferase
MVSLYQFKQKKQIMCVIIKNKGIQIPYVDFLKMWRINPDGLGIASRKINGDIWFQKYFISNSQELKKWYDCVYLPTYLSNDYVDTVIHFRYATDGDICVKNIHPFKFKDSNGDWCYAFHNGVMDDKYRNYSISEKYITSDTANFVQDFLVAYRFNFSDELPQETRDEITEEIASSKLVIISPSVVHTFNEELGVVRNGNWFSNVRWDFNYRSNYQTQITF